MISFDHLRYLIKLRSSNPTEKPERTRMFFRWFSVSLYVCAGHTHIHIHIHVHAQLRLWPPTMYREKRSEESESGVREKRDRVITKTAWKTPRLQTINKLEWVIKDTTAIAMEAWSVCTAYVICVCLSAVCLHLINTCMHTSHNMYMYSHIVSEWNPNTQKNRIDFSIKKFQDSKIRIRICSSFHCTRAVICGRPCPMDDRRTTAKH